MLINNLKTSFTIFVLGTLVASFGFAQDGREDDYPREAVADTLLSRAAARGDIAKLSELLKNKTTKSNIDDQQGLAVRRAIEGGHIEALRFLWAHGADLNLGDGKSYEEIRSLGAGNMTANPPMVVAAGKGRKDIVEFLLQNGANPRVLGGEALKVSLDYSDLALLLIDKGVRADFKDFSSMGTTSREVLDKLVEKGMIKGKVDELFLEGRLGSLEHINGLSTNGYVIQYGVKALKDLPAEQYRNNERIRTFLREVFLKLVRRDHISTQETNGFKSITEMFQKYGWNAEALEIDLNRDAFQLLQESDGFEVLIKRNFFSQAQLKRLVELATDNLIPENISKTSNLRMQYHGAIERGRRLAKTSIDTCNSSVEKLEL
jgi:hypothetical protein